MHADKVINLTAVEAIKFIEKEKWIVIGISDDSIHVYNCASVTQMQKIKSFQYFGDHHCSLAVHPIQPYVLTTGMVLWDGNKGWERTARFTRGGIRQVAFNPKDPNSYASASFDGRVEVWPGFSS